jgi:polyhydroxyalkanoate synthesis regulator phasin
MAGFGNLVQKAFYLGVGIASYAGEKAGGAWGDLRNQAQKLVDELVERGELTAEEAQKMMNDMVARAEASATASATVEDNREASAPSDIRSGPRQIQIVDDSESLSEEERQAEALRKEVEKLRQELKKLK